MDKVEEVFYKIAAGNQFATQMPSTTTWKPNQQAKTQTAAPMQTNNQPASTNRQPTPTNTSQANVPVQNTPQKPIPYSQYQNQLPARPQNKLPGTSTEQQVYDAGVVPEANWNAMTPEQQQYVINNMSNSPMAQYQTPQGQMDTGPRIGAATQPVYDPNTPASAFAFKEWKDKTSKNWEDRRRSREAWPQIQKEIMDDSVQWVNFPEGSVQKGTKEYAQLASKHIQYNPVTGTPLLVTPGGAVGAAQAVNTAVKAAPKYIPKIVQTVGSKLAPFAGKAEKVLDTAGTVADVYDGITGSNSISEAAQNVSNNLNQSGALGHVARVRIPVSVARNTGHLLQNGVRGARVYKNEENVRNVYNTVANE